VDVLCYRLLPAVITHIFLSVKIIDILVFHYLNASSVLQILSVSHQATGSLLLTKFIEFLDQSTNSMDASAIADIMEFLCIVDNGYLASGSCSERALLEVSEELLWCHVLEHLLDHLSSISALCPVTAARLIVCLLNILTVVIGNTDIMLIDRACLDESHYLSVFEEQAAGLPADLAKSGCKLASKLLEYQLVDLPLVYVRRKTSASFSSKTVFRIVDMLLLICRKTDAVELSGFFAHGKCQKIVGITWLHPLVMWSLRQRIFMRCYYELSSTAYDVCIQDEIVSLCDELKSVACDIDQTVAELTELQENPQHQFERALFIIRHRLEGYEG